MQISGANLLIAAQQQLHATSRASRDPQFAASLSKAGETSEGEFAPLSFKAAEAPGKVPEPSPAQQAVTAPKPGQRLGSTVNIRV